MDVRDLAAPCLLFLAATGCDGSDPDSSRADDASECTGDFDDFSLGLRKQAPSTEIEVEIVAAEPDPPVVRGDNAWRVRITDAVREPIVGAKLTVSPYMPKHQHGAAEVVVKDLATVSTTSTPSSSSCRGFGRFRSA